MEQTVTPEPGAQIPQTPSSEADLLFDEKRYAEAGEKFLQLSVATEAPLTQIYKLRGADAFLMQGDVARARTIAQATDVSSSDIETRLHKHIILAETEMVLGAPSLVAQLLTDSPEPEGEKLRARFHAVRARAFEFLEEPLQAARERVKSDRLVFDEERARNQRYLWDDLRKPSNAELGLAQADPDPTFAGWAGLSLLARKYLFDKTALEDAIGLWATQFPGHPAQELVVPELLTASVVDLPRPTHVALLLPLEGSFATAAAVVQDGFMSAWTSDNADSARPRVSVWNTGGQDVIAVYRQAVAQGADFVVGPLEKESVATLMRSGVVQVPMIALNRPGEGELSATSNPSDTTDANKSDTQLPQEEAPAIGLAASTVFQFALSPEGEAESVAERAWSDGLTSAAVLYPQGMWGERVASSFSEEWQKLGGTLDAQQDYDTQARDMSDPVTSLLLVDESSERWRALKGALGANLEFEPRRRQDMDYIFMAAYPRQARQLRPTLMFHHASKVPIYATSHIYAAVPDPQHDIDLESIIFGDMPWVLAPTPRLQAMRLEAQAKWGSALYSVTRLYAFGIDAYAMIDELNALRRDETMEYAGATGWLKLRPDGTITRRLVWAQFVGGLPVLLDQPPVDSDAIPP